MRKVAIIPLKNILPVLLVTLCTVLAGAFAGKLVLDNRMVIFLGVGFLGFIFFLYKFYFEGLILFLLMINEEFFYLLPRLGGQKNYQDALFPVILCIGAFFLSISGPTGATSPGLYCCSWG